MLWTNQDCLIYIKVETIVLHLYQSDLLVTCARTGKYGQRFSEWSYPCCICNRPLAWLQVSKQYCLEMDRRRDTTIRLYGNLSNSWAMKKLRECSSIMLSIFKLCPFTRSGGTPACPWAEAQENLNWWKMERLLLKNTQTKSSNIWKRFQMRLIYTHLNFSLPISDVILYWRLKFSPLVASTESLGKGCSTCPCMVRWQTPRCSAESWVTRRWWIPPPAGLTKTVKNTEVCHLFPNKELKI